MKAGGGIQAILDLIRRRVKSRRGAMLGIGVLCAGVDVATANNTISIVMTSELARDISQEYGIDPKQTASLLDICTSIVQGSAPLRCAAAVRLRRHQGTGVVLRHRALLLLSHAHGRVRGGVYPVQQEDKIKVTAQKRLPNWEGALFEKNL